MRLLSKSVKRSLASASTPQTNESPINNIVGRASRSNSISRKPRLLCCAWIVRAVVIIELELGWAPIPSSSSIITTARTIHAQHNSLGFRDIEFERDARPTMLFIGDSFVWGVDAEANERFTDLLRSRISNTAIVNAGVSGYGTDQEYLLLQRIWPTFQPAVVVLIFCTANDRLDNGTNVRYDGYQKPYFATATDGTLM